MRKLVGLKDCPVPKCKKRIRPYSDYCYHHKRTVSRGLDPTKDNSPKGENHPWWKGGTSIYPNHRLLNKRKQEKIKLHGGCEDCGNTEKLHIHHLDKDKSNHEYDNLRLVCPKCHISIYHDGECGKPTKRYNGMTTKQIAEQIGCSRRTVWNHLNSKKSPFFGDKIDALLE